MKRVINKLQDPYLAFLEYRKNQEKNFNRHADKEPLKPLDLKAVDPYASTDAEPIRTMDKRIR